MNKGFSLLEALIAAIILSIGFTALNWSLGALAKINSRNGKKFNIHQKIISKAEELSAFRYLADSTWETEKGESELFVWELSTLDSLDIEDLAIENLWDETQKDFIYRRPQEAKLTLTYTNVKDTMSSSIYFSLKRRP